jgi:preprotein translocase SecF subunit
MIQKSKIWLIISLVTMLASVVIVVTYRPVWGIDFTGGSLLEIFSDAESDQIESLIKSKLDLMFSVQQSEEGRLLLRSQPLNESQHQAVLALLQGEGLMEEELRFESIGPTIGAELRRKALVAVAIVLVVLIAYLAYTFRQAAGFISAWKFGVAAIYALLHDLLCVFALFVILGKLYGVAIDTMFVTAILAILGYSVNDTIVVFHRLKSDWLASRSGGLLTILDGAVKMSLMRSLNTSLTTLLVLGSLLLLGGSSIRWFIVALAAGTIAGTYSSLFVAPPFLYYLAKKK